MVCSKKRQIIEEVPHGVCLNTWLKVVQEAAFVLGKIETKNVTSPRARSRSVLQAKLLALEIKALPKDSNVDVLIANTPKGEQNRNPMKNSYGLSSCKKTFCVAKKWWDIRPKNSDGASKLLLVYYSSHFKGLYRLLLCNISIRLANGSKILTIMSIGIVITFLLCYYVKE